MTRSQNAFVRAALEALRTPEIMAALARIAPDLQAQIAPVMATLTNGAPRPAKRAAPAKQPAPVSFEPPEDWETTAQIRERIGGYAGLCRHFGLPVSTDLLTLRR